MSGVLSPHSTVLLASYGGPCQPEDALPFMHSAAAGRDVPGECLLEVSQHYQLSGGHSPTNKQNRALRDALAAELKRQDCLHPVVIGNHNWTPFFAETVSALHHDRHNRVVALTTAAYSHYPAYRQYWEDLATVVEQIPGVVIDKVGPYPERDSFISVSVDALVASMRASRSWVDDGVMRMLFVIYSTPVVMNTVSANGTPAACYDARHVEAASRVAEAVEAYLGKRPDWELVYCSHSDSPHISWLEPDVSDRLTELTGVVGVVAAPIGFISGHMEVAYDLGTQARESAAAAGSDYERAATVDIHPDFIAILTGLLLKQAAVIRGEFTPPDHPYLMEPASCRLLHPQKEQTHVLSASHVH